jgi:hypothetical protein
MYHRAIHTRWQSFCRKNARRRAGITGVARSAGAALALLFTGFLFSVPSLIDWPFFIAGSIKIGYDLLLYRAFVRLRPPEEPASE